MFVFIYSADSVYTRIYVIFVHVRRLYAHTYLYTRVYTYYTRWALDHQSHALPFAARSLQRSARPTAPRHIASRDRRAGSAVRCVYNILSQQQQQQHQRYTRYVLLLKEIMRCSIIFRCTLAVYVRRPKTTTAADSFGFCPSYARAVINNYYANNVRCAGTMVDPAGYNRCTRSIQSFVAIRNNNIALLLSITLFSTSIGTI